MRFIFPLSPIHRSRPPHSSLGRAAVRPGGVTFLSSAGQPCSSGRPVCMYLCMSDMPFVRRRPADRRMGMCRSYFRRRGVRMLGKPAAGGNAQDSEVTQSRLNIILRFAITLYYDHQCSMGFYTMAKVIAIRTETPFACARLPCEASTNK